MTARNRSAIRTLLLHAVLSALALSACGQAADATPTLSVESIATNAYMTFSAEMATKIPLTPPPNTPAPSPTPLPTLPAVSALPTFAFASATPLVGGTSNCDDAVYAADVTIPDGTILQPGESFVKTWRFLNSGTCAWNTSYRLVFVSGDSMGATSAGVPLAERPEPRRELRALAWERLGLVRDAAGLEDARARPRCRGAARSCRCTGAAAPRPT